MTDITVALYLIGGIIAYTLFTVISLKVIDRLFFKDDRDEA